MSSAHAPWMAAHAPPYAPSDRMSYYVSPRRHADPFAVSGKALIDQTPFGLPLHSVNTSDAMDGPQPRKRSPVPVPHPSQPIVFSKNQPEPAVPRVSYPDAVRSSVPPGPSMYSSYFTQRDQYSAAAVAADPYRVSIASTTATARSSGENALYEEPARRSSPPAVPPDHSYYPPATYMSGAWGATGSLRVSPPMASGTCAGPIAYHPRQTVSSSSVVPTAAATTTGKVRSHDLRDADFHRTGVLGQGGLSTVFSAVYAPTGQAVAIKSIALHGILGTNREGFLTSEINLHRSLRHANIVKLYSYYLSDHDRILNLVLELCPNGSLQDKLNGSPGGRFSEKTTIKCLRPIVRALGYLHERGIVHRDLKLENVLLATGMVVKLADFGYSRQIEERTDRDGAGGSPKGRLTVCGTLDYLSPEMLLQQPHTAKTDVWSLGAMAVEMLLGQPPFYDPSTQKTLEAIRYGEPRLPPIEGEGNVVGGALSREGGALLKAMLSKDPSKRPTIPEIAAHPWLARRD